jgi:alcohol dehydrogenase (cytochrome c)
VLVDAAWKGEPRKLLVQANRNGYYYILDRTNGKFLQGTPFVNKITWARGLTEDGRPVVVPEAAPTPQGTKVCPSTAGATNWPSPAYSPDTNLFYLISQEGCGFNFKITTNFDLDSPRSPGNGTGYTESSEEQEQWELHVIALNLTSGEKVWDYKQIGSRHYGPGVLSTAGGVGVVTRGGPPPSGEPPGAGPPGVGAGPLKALAGRALAIMVFCAGLGAAAVVSSPPHPRQNL